jgi:DNA adenine methylase
MGIGMGEPDDRLPQIEGEPLLYCDPPYYRKAENLYLNFYVPEDHERIAEAIQQTPRRWIVSYDAAPEIIRNYPDRRSFVYDLQYKAGTVYKGREVMIFSDDLAIPRKSIIPSLDLAMLAHHRIE